MNYISVEEAAEKWEMTPRRVRSLCVQNKVDGARKDGGILCR